MVDEHRSHHKGRTEDAAPLEEVAGPGSCDEDEGVRFMIRSCPARKCEQSVSGLHLFARCGRWLRQGSSPFCPDILYIHAPVQHQAERPPRNTQDGKTSTLTIGRFSMRGSAQRGTPTLHQSR